MVCSASSSDASIELRWADLTLFTPFLRHFVSVVSTPAEPVQASLLEPGTHSLEVLERILRFSPATYNILTYYNRHQEIAGELESPRKARLISGISARQARIKRQKGLTLTTSGSD